MTPPSDAEPGRRAGWRAGLQVAFLALPACLLAYQGWEYRWIADDGFINVRIVQNVLDGYGPVYNIGERVETYTSALWIGILSLVGALGVRLEHAAVGLGLTLTAGGALFGTLGARRTLSVSMESPSRGIVWFPLGMGTYAVLPAAWEFTTTGLETGLSMGWLGGTYYLVARTTTARAGASTNRRWQLGTAAVAGLGPLIRPELALFSIAFALPLLSGWGPDRADRPKWGRRLLEVGLWMGAIPVAYQIFRMGYFGAMVPNTALAKSAFGARWDQGWAYFDNFYKLYSMSTPMAITGVVWLGAAGRALKQRSWTVAALVVGPTLAGLAYTAFVIRIGGGYMHGRLLLPALFGMLLPTAAVPLWQPRRETTGRLVRLGLVAVASTWMYHAASTYETAGDGDDITDDRDWFTGHAPEGTPVELEDFDDHYFSDVAPNLQRVVADVCDGATFPLGPEASRSCDPALHVDNPAKLDLIESPRTFELREEFARSGPALAVARTTLGLKGMALGSHTHIVDNYGLASPLVSRLEVRNRGRPGHERSINYPWLMGRFSAPRIGERWRVSQARRALGCGDLARLERAVHGELTAGQFLANLYNAFRLHGVTIPRSTRRAEARFCGAARGPSVDTVHGGEGGTRRRLNCPVGYAAVGIETSFAAETPIIDEGALVHLQLDCRPVDPERARTVSTRSVGGDADGREQRLGCESSQWVSGIAGGADGYVRRLRARCRRADGDRRSESGTEPPRTVGRGGEDFSATCPDGEVVTSLGLRSGALIDAVGIGCRPVSEIAGRTPGSLD